MKKHAITALAATAAVLCSTSPAAAGAYPIKNPKLTANPLYDSGALPRTECAEKPVKRGNKALIRAYINAVVDCLDTTWEKHLAAADLPFQKVQVKHVNKIGKKHCGFEVPSGDSVALYCPRTRTITFLVGKDWLSEPTDLWIFQTTSRLYGQHVQQLVGIQNAYEDEPYSGKAEMNEQARRLLLQSDCLGSAFLKSVWPLKGRSTKDWQELLGFIQGDKRGEERIAGKTGTIKAWMRKGFATGDPASCNTWTASTAKVA